MWEVKTTQPEEETSSEERIFHKIMHIAKREASHLLNNASVLELTCTLPNMAHTSWGDLHRRRAARDAAPALLLWKKTQRPTNGHAWVLCLGAFPSALPWSFSWALYLGAFPEHFARCFPECFAWAAQCLSALPLCEF
jgi:hypothetical protein